MFLENLSSLHAAGKVHRPIFTSRLRSRLEWGGSTELLVKRSEVNRGSKERVSETQLAGGQMAGLDQTNAATEAAPLSASNRYTGRVEHDATYRKQRTGCMSTRHSRKGADDQTNPAAGRRPESR